MKFKKTLFWMFGMLLIFILILLPILHTKQEADHINRYFYSRFEADLLNNAVFINDQIKAGNTTYTADQLWEIQRSQQQIISTYSNLYSLLGQLEVNVSDIANPLEFEILDVEPIFTSNGFSDSHLAPLNENLTLEESALEEITRLDNLSQNIIQAFDETSVAPNIPGRSLEECINFMTMITEQSRGILAPL